MGSRISHFIIFTSHLFYCYLWEYYKIHAIVIETYNNIWSHFLPELREGGGTTEVEYPPFEWLLSPKSKIGLGLGVYSRRGRD